MAKPPKGILLDIDGTLVLSNDAHARLWVKAFAQSGYKISYDKVRPLIGMGSDRILPTLVPGLEKDSPIGKEITASHNHLFLSEAAPNLQPTPGARPLIQRLIAEDFKLLAVSSANPSQLEALFETAQVKDFLIETAPTEEVDSSKPAPDIVRAALKKIGFPPEQVMMLGDTIYDLEAATKAGVRMIALRCGGTADEKLAAAAAIYDNPQDLLEHFNSSPLAKV